MIQEGISLGVELEGPKERLHLVKANLVKKVPLTLLWKLCEGVFHTASLLSLLMSKTLRQNSRASSERNSQCSKVMCKSTIFETSCYDFFHGYNVCNGKPKTPEIVVDETWFSDPEFVMSMSIEIPSASGRYCLVESVKHHSEL
ncbi:uncharacterized protein LOC114745306 [Neltuma alba]|uniref:uncharacterized protein LOC114745306 n=1 Tax=Neltuma alba TaxID=207710 RepID=UPI0010A5A0FA|nr:uncharacterized protein LOC114745306 [Prosopis alba]